MKVLAAFIVFFALMQSCSNTEIGSDKDVSPDAIYYDYKVWSEEGSENVTIKLQYRFGGDDGTTLVLEEPANVMLDDKVIEVDSAKMEGAYYEISRPAQEFTGKHQIVFTDRTGKQHKEAFEYRPFTLAAELPEQIKKEPVIIKLANFNPAPTQVHFIMTDTAFGTRDVNEEVLIKNGELKITSQHWEALTSGPVVMEIFIEEQRPLKNPSKEGGRLLLTYSLRRQFELFD